MRSIGDRIKEARLLRGLTQTELAERIGVKFSAVHKYEAGLVTNIPIERIEKISAVLNVSILYLLGIVDNPARSTIANKLPMGEKITMVRRKHGLSLSALASAANVSVVRLNSLELLRAEPTLEELERLASALDVPLSALANETERWRLENPEQAAKRRAAESQAELPEGVDPDVGGNDYFEEELLRLCETFNDEGKNAVLDRVSEMTEIQRYRKYRFDEPDY